MSRTAARADRLMKSSLSSCSFLISGTVSLPNYSRHVGGKGWIAVKLDTDPPWSMVEALVAQAYELIKSKQKPKRR